ncbi:hypothetical protein A2397_06190 [Candidatus Amesbacteria bacterium RIFOXYB1_FULL_44_23]|uniref:HTH crp-type domain-containing protein n=1 Tax=Candidatus Amesbacteria bacterium RIFOXYB1_FULL_44_23 TaxID=1797263 RepID=A0A1F4ZU09_9BACT|nr:MAG: hypothetical protein A2397_06190 [Candidatus Amesbacteria bacterium RIFOXYB1_FULL_44_23]
MVTNKTSSDRLIKLFATAYPLTFSKNETIIRADDTPQGVYYLAKGFVKMNSQLFDGREITLNIFRPGSYFPMMWAISDLPNVYNFQAMTSVELRRISQADFLEFVKSHPNDLLEISRRILVGVNGLLFNINHILSGDSYHRMIAAIMMLAKRFGEKDAKGKTYIAIPLTHQDLANVAAITRETASVNLKKLESRGLISQKSHFFTISDIKLLETESNIENPELPALSAL